MKTKVLFVAYCAVVAGLVLFASMHGWVLSAKYERVQELEP